MQIILKVKTRFALYEEKTVTKFGSDETVKSVTNSVVVSPSQKPQVVPDWIDSDPIFALMVKDGTLIQVPAATQTEAPTTTANAETATQDSGKKKSK